MIIPAEKQFTIVEFRAWITRDGYGMVSDHVRNVEKFATRETRYKILRANGVGGQGAEFYLSPMEDECAHASAVIKPTRKYKRMIDSFYFKYYDDADEVRQNIILFIVWLKNRIKNASKKDLKKLMTRNGHKIKDVVPTLEWERMMLLDGLNVKRRSDLSPLARDLQDELDLIGHD